MGLVLIIAGLGFKVAAVPFHMWTPDAYEGAPLPITAYLSATSKAAGFALLLRLFTRRFDAGASTTGSWMIAGLAAATMILGNLVALQQHNIKRLLAYSSHRPGRLHADGHRRRSRPTRRRRWCCT